MPRTIATTVYQFDELCNEAKVQVRRWYAEKVLAADGSGGENVLDVFAKVCGILGMSLLPVGAFANNAPAPSGAGVGFEGLWRHAPVSSRRIREYAPRDECLHAIADALAAAQARNGGELAAGVTRTADPGGGCSMRVDVGRKGFGPREPAKGTGRIVREEMRKLARWLDAAIEKELEDQRSETTVDEIVRARKLEFSADGTFFATEPDAGAAVPAGRA